VDARREAGLPCRRQRFFYRRDPTLLEFNPRSNSTCREEAVASRHVETVELSGLRLREVQGRTFRETAQRGTWNLALRLGARVGHFLDRRGIGQ
jgi:hypothetical protein